MKKERILLFIMGLVLLFSTAALPIAAEQTEDIDYHALYAPILEADYQYILGQTDEEDIPDSHIGIWEASRMQDPADLLRSIGYAILDINGDGIPELLVGFLPVEYDGVTYGNTILTVHTLKDGAPALVLSGWARNSYSLLPDGSFLNIGSNGAAYSILGLFTLPENEAELTCLDYYFTHEKGDDFQDIRVYRNQDAVFDPETSEELDMTPEEFWQMEDILHQQAVAIDLIPFGEEFGMPSYVQAEWDDSEAQGDAHVLFEPIDGGVTDFKLLAIQLESVDALGRAEYTVTGEKSYGDLEPNYPITLSLTFFGDIPNNGISYIDSIGQLRRFAVCISGEDGSLILLPF